MILKNLWRRKTRTFLTMLGIAVGVAAVVALSAFGEGFASGFESAFSTADADLTVAQKDAMMALLSAVDDQVGDEIRQMPGVEEVAGTVAGFLTYPEVPYFIVMGQDPRGFAIQHYTLIAGQPLSTKKQILIGKLTAKTFKKQVGDTFRINDLSYRIVGIYETGVNLEDGGAVIGLADAQRAFDKPHQVSYYNVKVKDKRKIEEVRKEIEARWDDLAVSRSGEATTQTEMLGLYRSFGWFLGIFAILVGGLGMMNTTLMSVFERTREIGVLRAVGWRRRRIIGMILGESVVLALIGGVVGIALGIGLTSLARLSPAVESLLSGVFTPSIFIQAMVTALLLGTIGGLYPAWRAAQLQPVEAMRYESGAGGNLGPITRILARSFGSGSLRNLWRRPTRTLITVVGIGIGVGFIVALIATTDGFTALFTQLGSAGEIDLIAEQAKASDMSLSVIDERVVDRIRTHPEVKSAAGLVMGFTTAPGLPYFMIWGLDPRDEYIKHYRIREGRTLERPREIIVGRFAANGLKKGVGDTIRVAGATYQIVGIYENGAAYEDGGAVISLKETQQIFRKPRQVSFLGIAVNDPARADEIADELQRDYPELTIAKTTNFIERTNEINVTYTTVNALVVLTMIVGGIVIMNAMLMSVFERTQEIGVLRAVGWKRRRVLRMVLIESLALSLLSGLAGIGIGAGLAYSFTLEPTFGQFLMPAYTPRLFAQVLILALVLGAIGGFYPAWRATRLPPIEALRYE